MLKLAQLCSRQGLQRPLFTHQASFLLPEAVEPLMTTLPLQAELT